MIALPRRAVCALVAGVLASGLLAGCSTGSTEASDAAQQEATTQVDADAFPVTIEHAFGETTIEEEPTRVATLGWTDQDVALAARRRARWAPPRSPGAATRPSRRTWFDEKLEELGGEQADPLQRRRRRARSTRSPSSHPT